MKKKNTSINKIDGSGLKVAIIISKYNEEYGDTLLLNTVETLKNNGVKEIVIEKVPGALELPFVAKKLCMKKEYDVLIALGTVIKGDTYHFELVCNESYRGLMDVSCSYDTPVIYGIICAYNQKQIEDRCSADKQNKGAEFAITAIEMALLNKRI